MFGSTLLVIGKEAMLADRAIDERLTAARREADDVEVTRVSAAELDGESRFSEVTGGSLFSSRRAVVIEDVADLATDLHPRMLELAADPGEDLSLTLVHGGGQKGKKLIDGLGKAGVEKFAADPIKPWKVGEFVAAEARRAGLRMDTDGVQALVDALGSDLRALVGAIRQLADDWSDVPVSAARVQQYFAGRAEITSFKVADDVMAGRPSDALVKLRWLLASGGTPVMVTSALASQLRLLGRYFGVRHLRMSPADMASTLGTQPWRLKSLPDLARRWTPAGVADALVAVAAADAEVKGKAFDPEFALEQMLLSVERARTDGHNKAPRR